MKSSEIQSNDNESENKEKSNAFILRNETDDPYLLNVSPSKLTYMNKDMAESKRVLEEHAYRQLYTAEKKEVEPQETLTYEELNLKLNDPEIFLFHMLVKKMRRNKAAKTIQENGRKVLN